MKNHHSIKNEFCSCIKQVVVDKLGNVVITPDYQLLSTPDYSITPLEGCFCPRNADELKKCLIGCLNKVLSKNGHHVADVKSVFIIDETGKELKLI